MSYTDRDFPHAHMYDSDLRELIHKVCHLWEKVNELDGWKNTHEKEYEELKALYDAIMSGNFPPEIVDAFNKWFLEHGRDIIGEVLKLGIYFKLTDDGYFTAYIPEEWSQLQFATTGLDIWTEVQPEFGHLCILY